MSKKVLLTGATGATGKSAVREAIALGLNVRAMVHKKDSRSEAIEKLGAEVVVGDLFDPNTVRAAMKGVEAAWLCYPVAPGLVQASVNFLYSAKEAGLNLVINHSQRSTNRDSLSDATRDHAIVEELFSWSGIPHIELRPTLFDEWLLYPWQLYQVQQGNLYVPGGKARHSAVAGEDQGRAVAALLKNPEDHIGKVVPLSGPVEIDYSEMAEELTTALGRKITYANPSIDEYCAVAEKIGVPPFGVNHFRGQWTDYQNGRMSGWDNNIEKLTGKKPMTIGEFARAHVAVLNGK